MPSTASVFEQTLAALDLRENGEDRFEAERGLGGHRLFGGLVAAQTVIAAGRTVEPDRKLHSLHAYFLRPGDGRAPTRFEVSRTRDGGSYRTRHVTATQNDRAIFEAVLSFARDEEGLEHQSIEMPVVPGPDGLLDREQERSRRYREKLGLELRPYHSAVEVRLCEPSIVEPEVSREPRQDNWLRASGPLGEDQLLQRAMLVYASDRTLLATARMPYDLGRHRLISVSLDHAVWIHRDIDLNEWHLCCCESPVGGGRAILLSHLYRSDGVCVATVAQEGLVRVRRDRPES